MRESTTTTTRPEDRAAAYAANRAARLAAYAAEVTIHLAGQTYAAPSAPRMADVPSIHATTVGHVPTPSVDGPYVPRLAAWMRYPSSLGQRIVWPAGFATRARWKVRAELDQINRARVEAEIAEENQSKAWTGVRGQRAMRAIARAIARGEVLPDIDHYVAVDDAPSWDEWSMRGITNARDTRAAERGRGSHHAAPSAAMVTMRDAHSAWWSLSPLRTVGHATPAWGQTIGPDDSMVGLYAVMDDPTRASYRRYNGPAWMVDPDWGTDSYRPGHAGQTYVGRIRGIGPTDAGTVCPVHVPQADDDTTTTTRPQATRQSAYAARLDADYRMQAAMGSVYAAEDKG